MNYIAYFLHNPIEFFKDERNQKILILSIFVFVFVCLLIRLVRGASHHSEEAANNDEAATPSVSMTSTITPTKWWIKITATSSLTPSGLTTSAVPAAASNCLARFSSPLKAEIYAYISFTPPLPNRIRSGAGLSNTYLGQIEPGDGLKVIDGPICADGYSWWLVEALHGDLRGWTVEGKSSEQWIVPCPNESVACNQTAVPASSSMASKNDKNKDQNNCKSDKFAVGMFAQVGQDSLLVVRSEPHTGGVTGAL